MPSSVTSLLDPGRTGRADGPPGLVVRECAYRRSASLIARRGAADRAAEAALAAFGVRLPTTPRAASGGGATFIWTGPAQWLVEMADGPEEIEARLAAAFGSLVSVCEQSDSRVVVEVAGPQVRAVLAKGLPIDLHPDRFRTGDVAITAVGHVGVHLRQTAEAPIYRLAVVRSYFGSFWHWLASSAAEFGCEVLVAAPGDGDPPGG